MKRANSNALVLKGDDDDAAGLVTKALADLTSTVDERIKGVETKAAKADALEARLTALEVKSNRPAGGGNPNEMSIERKAFVDYLRHGNNAPADSLKALIVSNDTQGGYFAPPELSAEIIRNLVEFSPVRSIASVRSTGSPSVTYPVRTGVTNAKWKGETQTSETSDPSFGQAEVMVKEINTFIDISNSLLADSGGAVETEVNLALAEDFGKKEGTAFLLGDGNLAPAGLLLDSRVSIRTGASATAVTGDELIDVMYGIPSAFRSNGTWGMNYRTLSAVRKLKDGQGNYLWQPGLQAGQPETLLGRPIVEMPDLDDIASGKTPIIFGDFSGYRIVDRAAMTILVNPYINATLGLTRIHATRRVGGAVIRPEAFRKFRNA